MRLRLVAMMFLSVCSALGQDNPLNAVEKLNRQILARPHAGLLRERARLLRAQIVRSPGQAAKAMFSLPDVQRLRGVAPADADLEVQESAITRTVIVADSADHKAATRIYLLDTPRGRVLAYQDAATAPSSRCGDEIHVHGLRLGAVMLVTRASVVRSATAQPNCSALGEHRVAVLYLKLPGMPDPPVTIAEVRAQFFSSQAASANTFYLEGSYGQASITGDVFGPFTMDRVYSCEETEPLLENAIRAASTVVDFSQYSHIHMLHPNLPGGCEWAGSASVGCRSVAVPNKPDVTLGVSWQNVFSSYLLREAVHEIGHNFGLNHSRSVEYPGEPLGPDQTRAIYTEYGDYFSSMGYFDAYHFAAPHKALLAWITEGDTFATVESDGEFEILPTEAQSPGLKALRVRRDLGETSEWLWIEYRQPLGLFDGKMPPTGWGGAMLHQETAVSGYHADALDFSPRPPGSSASSFNDNVLAPGRLWQDPYSALTLEVVSATSVALKVRIRYSPACASISWPPDTYVGPAGGPWRPAISTLPGCSVPQLANSSWIVARADRGFDVLPNRSAFLRIGSVTVARQTRTVVQLAEQVAPSIDFVSPSQGTLAVSDSVPFMVGVSAPNGIETVRFVRVLIGSTANPASSCYMQFDVTYGGLALYNDAGSGLAGALAAGASGSLQNTQCTVAAAGVSFLSRTYLQLGFSIASKAALIGDKRIFVAADHALDVAPAALESRGNLTVSSGCTGWFSPPRIDAPGDGGSYILQQGSACAWSLAGIPDWISLERSTGPGPLRFTVSVKPNSTAAERDATLQTAGLAVTVHQAAAGYPARPALSFANSEVRLGRAAGTGILYFSSNLPAAALAPTVSDPWLTASVAVDPALGPTLTYSFTANPSPEPRSAELVIAGMPLTFLQDAGTDPPGDGYLISTLAGRGDIGDGDGARAAFLGSPAALAFDSSGNLFIAEQDFYRVRKVAPDGSIVTVAGSGFAGASSDGTPAIEARFYTIRGIAVDSQGNLLIAEGSSVRKVAPDGTLSTLTSAIYAASGIAVDAGDRVYIADSVAHVIWRVNTDGGVSIIAGTGAPGFTGDGGPAVAATLNGPTALALDGAGNLYIADGGNYAVRKITGATISTIVGTGRPGLSRDGVASRGAAIDTPGAVAVDAAGNVFLTENARVRRIDTPGLLSTLGGGGSTRAEDGRPGLSVSLPGTPQGLAIAPSGQLIFSDTASHVVRGMSGAGALETIAGAETWAAVGEGVPGCNARRFFRKAPRSGRTAVYSSPNTATIACAVSRRMAESKLSQVMARLDSQAMAALPDSRS